MLLKRPTDASIREMLRSITDCDPSYVSTGSLEEAAFSPSNFPAPKGFEVDTASFLLGRGQADWELAKMAIRSWAMFPANMVSTVRLSNEIKIGTTVAVLFRGLGLLTINPARIISVTDESTNDFHRYGFTYVTMPGHAECGEEFFCVQWSKENDQVTYELIAVSKPSHILARLGYFYSRLMQARFRVLSGKSMQDFVIKNRPSS